MNIGYFFDSYESAKQYADDLFALISRNVDTAKFKQKDLSIEYFGNKLRFIVIRHPKDVDKIQGHVYDGIFLKSVFSQEVDRFILSRFRPRCACKIAEEADKKITLVMEE